MDKKKKRQARGCAGLKVEMAKEATGGKTKSDRQILDKLGKARRVIDPSASQW